MIWISSCTPDIDFDSSGTSEDQSSEEKQSSEENQSSEEISSVYQDYLKSGDPGLEKLESYHTSENYSDYDDESDSL